MGTANRKDFFRRLTRGMAAERLADNSDRQLVERALRGQDETAFQAIVFRHGPMVYRVCWCVLQHSQDTEDAFQATFLVLAQKLLALRKHDSLASWLHGVAHRVALRAKGKSAARRRRECQSSKRELLLPNDVTWGELRSALDFELGQLPDNWRQPLVLCYLEGRTQDEAAIQLGWSKSKLRRHLDNGRAALGRRLAGRGIATPAALSAILLSDCLTSAAPTSRIVDSTVQAAVLAMDGKTVANVVTAKVATLTEGMVKAMLVAKVRTVISVIMLLGVVAGGLLTQYCAAGHPDDVANSAAEAKDGPPGETQQIASAEAPQAGEANQIVVDTVKKRENEPAADRVKCVRQMYAKLPSDILGIAEPIKRIVRMQIEIHSLQVLIEDASGKRETILLSRGFGKETDSTHLLTMGRLPARGPEESAVYGILLRLFEKPPEKTTKMQLQVIGNILEELDLRFAGALPTTSAATGSIIGAGVTSDAGLTGTIVPNESNFDGDEVYTRGPGELRSLGKGGPDPLAATPSAAQQGTPTSKPKPDGGGKPENDQMKMTYVSYGSSMCANSKKNYSKFLGNVRVLNFPCTDPHVDINLDVMLSQHLPEGAMYIRSDVLEVWTHQAKDRKYSEMHASGAALVQANEFWGRAATIHFDESKDQIIFDGGTRNALLFKVTAKGKEPDRIEAKRIIYIRSTGQFWIDRGTSINGMGAASGLPI